MFIMFFKAVNRHVTLLNVDLTKLHYLFMQCIICAHILVKHHIYQVLVNISSTYLDLHAQIRYKKIFAY